MSLMRALLLIILFAACTHAPVATNRSPADFRRLMKLSGEGKARLEIGAEAWVFGFEAAYGSAAQWVMGLRVPLQGEFSFDFPNLDQARAQVTPGPADFRWRIISALETETRRRNLGYPQAGSDFMAQLHHLLRLLAPESKVGPECRALGPEQWSCTADGQQTEWRWLAAKDELTLETALRDSWRLRTTFKNLTDSGFQRVTLEVLRRAADRDSVELRLELFFSTH